MGAVSHHSVTTGDFAITLEAADNSSDQLVLVDLADREIGTCGKLEAHQRGLLHRAFSVFLLDGDRALMTRRAMGKYHSGGLWTNTCCSHPRAGETLSEAVPRRLREELGIIGAGDVHEVGTYCYRACFDNGLIEYEMDHVFIATWSGDCTPDPAEVMDARWIGMDEVAARLLAHPERFTAWFPGVFQIAYAEVRGQGC